MSLWPTSGPTGNDGHDSALYVAVGQEDELTERWEYTSDEGKREKRGWTTFSHVRIILNVKPLRSCDTTVRQFQRSRRILEQFLE